MPRRAAADHRVCRVRQDAGHLAADRRRSCAQPGVEPRNIIAFTFTEKAAAELKERILSIVEKEGVDTLGLAEMYIGTMHGYALDLLQRLVPETFKFSVLTEITARMFVDRNSRKSGLTVCPTSSSGTPYLRRFLHSRLYLQATSVLREDAVDWDLVPAGVVSSFERLHEAAVRACLLRLHRDDQPRGAVPRG